MKFKSLEMLYLHITPLILQVLCNEPAVAMMRFVLAT